MSLVPWHSLEPIQCEKFVSIMLLREFPDGSRRRPARGDHGVDVLVPVPDDPNRYDVYQIKYFFKSLDRSQRSQIANSAATLLSAVRDETIRVRKWHLVLPLDPTENDEEWLRSQFEGTGIRAFWKGLSHLEGWASKYRDVVDYYILNGKERVNDLVNKALGLAEFRKGQGGEAGLSVSSIETGLTEIFDVLNSDDPHYRYELFVTTADMEITSLPAGVAMRHVSGRPDATVVIDVFPCYKEAPLDRPIEGELLVTVPRSNAALIQAIEDFRAYGTPLSIPSGFIEAVIDDPLSGLTFSDSFGVRIEPVASRRTPVRLRLIVVDTNGLRQAAVPVTVERFTTGELGGHIAHLRSDGSVVQVTHKAAPRPGPRATEFNLTASWRDVIAAKALNDIRFGDAIKPGRKIMLANEFTGPYTEIVTVNQDNRLVPDWLLPYCEALVQLQDYVDAELRLSIPVDGSSAFIREALAAQDFANGATITCRHERYLAEVEDPVEARELINSSNFFAARTFYGGPVAGVQVRFTDVICYASDVKAETVEINGKLYVALAGVKPGLIELTLQREQYYLAASDDIKG